MSWQGGKLVELASFRGLHYTPSPSPVRGLRWAPFLSGPAVFEFRTGHGLLAFPGYSRRQTFCAL